VSAVDEVVVRRAVRLAASGVTPERLQRIIARLLEEGADASPRQVIDALERNLRSGARLCGPVATEAALALLERAGARVLVPGSPGYCARLEVLWPELGAPLWLFVQPALAQAAPLPCGPAVAVVGTRQPSLDGLRTARELGGLLAQRGVVVVSGMARGIDQAAHRGALEAGGVTVAVLGAGFGVDYPRGDAALRDAIRGSGGLVSEVLPGTRPRPQGFLQRNRIISGLADVCVVVEGRTRSGTLRTAGMAAAQGRDVFAVPGSLHQPTAQAPLALIRDGARCLTRYEDVLELLPAATQPAAAVPSLDPAPAAVPGPPLQGLPAVVRALVGSMPATAGEVAGATGRPLPEVLAALSQLEERGSVRSTPRGYVGTGS